jgi:hypothetical protein
MRKNCRFIPIGTGVAVLLLIIGCSIPQPSGVRVSPRQSQESRIRAMLIAELTRRASAHPAPDSTNTRFDDVASEAVPQLIYHWGMYYPRSSPEGQFSAVVAERGRHIALVATTKDWIEAAGSYVPTTVDHLLAACREMILITNVPRSPNQPFAVFRNQETIDSLPLAVPDPGHLRRTLSPPEVTGGFSDGWQARVWVVHRRSVRRYECRLGHREGGGVSVVDSLPGYGFY